MARLLRAFCSMDGRLYNDMHYQSWLRMKMRAPTTMRIARGFDVHRVKPGDIVCQRNGLGHSGISPL